MKTCPHRNMLVNILSSNTHNSPKAKNPKCPTINQRIKNCVKYVYNKVLFSNKNGILIYRLKQKKTMNVMLNERNLS